MRCKSIIWKVIWRCSYAVLKVSSIWSSMNNFNGWPTLSLTVRHQIGSDKHSNSPSNTTTNSCHFPFLEKKASMMVWLHKKQLNSCWVVFRMQSTQEVNWPIYPSSRWSFPNRFSFPKFQIFISLITNLSFRNLQISFWFRFVSFRKLHNCRASERKM